MQSAPVYDVRPAGRVHLEVQVLYRPDKGTVSRTARVSIARRNLKEAAGKTPARRTEIAYEAAMPDEEATSFKREFKESQGKIG